MNRIQITVSELETILESSHNVIYWEDGVPKMRRNIFDDCEIIAIELDNTFQNSRLKPCISVYVGKRLGKGERSETNQP